MNNKSVIIKHIIIRYVCACVLYQTSFHLQQQQQQQIIDDDIDRQKDIDSCADELTEYLNAMRSDDPLLIEVTQRLCDEENVTTTIANEKERGDDVKVCVCV